MIESLLEVLLAKNERKGKGKLGAYGLKKEW